MTRKKRDSPGAPRAFCKAFQEEGRTPPKRKTQEWKDLVAWLEAEWGRKICAAYARSNGGWPCEMKQLANGRCRFHGGASPPPGPLQPAFKHGRYSKALAGQSIEELYQTARNDPHLLALTEEIALLVAKQQETLAKLRTGESGDAWAEAQYLYQNVMERITDKDEEGVTAALKQLGQILQGGMRDRSIWAEYTERAEMIRKLVDTERKYQEGLRLYLPLNQANAVMAVWLDCIRRVVPREYISELHKEFQSIRRTRDMPTIGASGREIENMRNDKLVNNKRERDRENL